MPTKERLDRRASDEVELDLHAASKRSGYAAETLRKFMWSDDPPPLFKHTERGRWRVRAGELDAWAARRRAAERES